MGKIVISPLQLKEMYREVAVIIGTPILTYINQITKQLLDMGFKEEDILFLCKDMGRQYFDLPELNLSEIDYFVDAGCFNGNDTLSFLEHCKNAKGAYIFEPDEKNLIIGKKQLQGIENLNLYPDALWDKKETISFSAENTGSSHIQSIGDNTLDCVSLDEVLDGKTVSYIKMDIEGSELNVLIGAKETIKRWRLKLAICVYHKKEDIYKIPQCLLKLVPDY